MWPPFQGLSRAITIMLQNRRPPGFVFNGSRDHLALDALGVYLDNPEQESDALQSDRLYDIMNRAVTEIEPGSGGVIFTPWLHGNRSPREDPFARGMFFNIGLNTGKRAMIRAVLEGMAYHIRWMLEAVEKKVPRQDTMRLVGGGAKSTVLCQILADVTGRCIQVPEDPQNVGCCRRSHRLRSGVESDRICIQCQTVYPHQVRISAKPRRPKSL